MDSKIIKLYDEYTHKPLNRKEFITKMIQLTGSITTAMSMISLLENNDEKAVTTENEAGLYTENVEWPADGGQMRGYVARPEKKAKYPGVIIIHENRGLNEHIKDVTRRAALAGFVALAPDGLSQLGGTPANADDARAMFSKLDAGQNTKNFSSAVKFLSMRDDCNGNTGCVGFCWGGAMANQLAVHAENIKAAIAFYGRQAAKDDVVKIKCPVQLHYAEKDERINAGMAEYEAELKAQNKVYEQYLYLGVDHAFHNNTSEARYNAEAANLAWERTLAFLKKHVGK